MYPNSFHSTSTPFNHIKDRSLTTNPFVSNIEKAINGEYSAIVCYEKLAQMAPTLAERNQILEIRKDEHRHFDTFRQIYTNLTGKQPTIEMTETCPNLYQAGLEYAFRDEQHTVDFYLDLADRAPNVSIKEAFQRAAANEQNHAVWFLSFLSTPLQPSRENRQVENYGAKGALNATTLTFPQMLTLALQDEYLAQARYNNILENFGDIRTFVQIKEAEARHIDALLPLFERYQVPVPEDISPSFVITPESIKAAYAASVQGEIDNINMYNKFLSYNIPADARFIFTQLRNASLNHLNAFERGLERK